MSLLTWMIYAALVAALLGAAAWVLERVLLPLGRPVRWLWVLALSGAVGIPFVALAWSGYSLLHPEAGIGPGGPDGGPAAPAVSATASAPGPVLRILREVSGGLTEGVRRMAESIAASGPSDGTLALLWAAGALLLSLTAAGATLRLRARLRRWPSVRLQGRDRVRITPGLGPAVIGLARPWIVLPRWVLELEPRRMGLILLHEEEHVSARDTVALAGAAAAVLGCFWNPPLWWILGRLRSSVEMDCDQRVLARGIPPGEYGTLLLEVSARGDRLPLHMAALAERTNLLERRLRQMKRVRPQHPLLALAGAGVAATVLILVACETQVPAPTEQTDQATTLLPVQEDARDTTGEVEVVGYGEREGGVGRVIVRGTDETQGPSPLVVVDGVIVGETWPIEPMIDADRIESIEVLKGAAAAARFGSRGQHGVIMITTRGGGRP